MKKLFTLLATAALAVPTNMMATDYYLSATGSDTNDGLSAATPFGSLSKVAGVMADGDVIYVSGMVAVSSEVALEGGTYTFCGQDDNAGFDGKGASRIFNTLNTSFTFSNLTFQNGYCNADGGGAMRILGGVVTFNKCVLKCNTADGVAGGALWTTNADITLNDSELYGNMAKAGGAIETRGGNLYINSTQFISNKAWLADLSRDGGIQGGALNVVDMTETVMTYATFDGNVSNMHGGAIAVAGDAVRTFKMMGCAVVNNMAGGEEGTYTPDGTDDYLDNGRTKAHGGAFMLTIGNNGDAERKYMFASTTIANNSCTQAGGAILVQNGDASNTLNFVNCTITKNSTADNVGNNGGICCYDKSCTVNLVNTILEGNWSDANNQWSDCWFTSTPANFYNSVVGYMFEYDNYFYSDTDSRMQTTPDGNTTELTSGIDLQMTCDANCFPLASGSEGTTMGDNSMAASYGVTKDQKGQDLTKPYIGAVQLLIGDAIPEVPTAISDIVAQGETTKASAAYGIYDINGRRVSTSPSDAAHLASGLYIVNSAKGIKKIAIK